MRHSFGPALLLVLVSCGCGTPTSPQLELAATKAADEVIASQPEAMSKPPTEYLDVHGMLYKTNFLEWKQAVEKLHDSGDLFTVHVIDRLKELDGEEKLVLPLRSDQVQALNELSTVIRRRDDRKSLEPDEVLPLLETVAYADVTCHFVENELQAWTLSHIAKFADRPEIRRELERIRASYESGFEEEMLATSMRLRVKHYVKGLLKELPVIE